MTPYRKYTSCWCWNCTMSCTGMKPQNCISYYYYAFFALNIAGIMLLCSYISKHAFYARYNASIIRQGLAVSRYKCYDNNNDHFRIQERHMSRKSYGKTPKFVFNTRVKFYVTSRTRYCTQYIRESDAVSFSLRYLKIFERW